MSTQEIIEQKTGEQVGSENTQPTNTADNSTPAAEETPEAGAAAPANEGGTAQPADLSNRFLELAAKAEIDPKFSLSAQDQADFTKWLEEGNNLDQSQLNDLVAKLKNGEMDLDKLGEQKPKEETKDLDPITLAMQEVGAKTPEELAEKIKGLKSSRDRTGSELGQKAKMLEEQNKALQLLIQDFAEGNPEAIKFLKEQGLNPKILAAQQLNQDDDDLDDLDLDDLEFETPREKKLREELEALKADKEAKEREFQAQQMQVKAQNDLIQLWSDFGPELMPQGKTPQQMLTIFEQWRDQAADEPTAPELQATIDLIEFARTNRIQSLNAAAKAFLFDKMQERILEAKRQGRQEVLNAPKSVGLAGKREGSATDGITDADIDLMERNQKPIPKDWFEADGYTPTDKMPALARRRLVGR